MKHVWFISTIVLQLIHHRPSHLCILVLKRLHFSHFVLNIYFFHGLRSMLIRYTIVHIHNTSNVQLFFHMNAHDTHYNIHCIYDIHNYHIFASIWNKIACDQRMLEVTLENQSVPCNEPISFCFHAQDLRIWIKNCFQHWEQKTAKCPAFSPTLIVVYVNTVDPMGDLSNQLIPVLLLIALLTSCR